MIILASKSPRRKELLSLITDDFTVDSAEVDETLPCDIEPDKAVEYLSKIKAQPFRKSGKIVIGADTVVAIDGKTMTSTDVLTSVLADSKPGDTVKLTIARIENNSIKTSTVECKLMESKGDSSTQSNSSGE